MIVIFAAGSLQAGDEPKKTPDAKNAVGSAASPALATASPPAAIPAISRRCSSTTADKYIVKNFGVGGATMMMKSDRPYGKQKKYEDALKFEPDVVVLMLGTNDTRRAGPNTYQHIADFVPDGKKIVESFQALSPAPKIFLCLPVPIYGEGNFGLNNENLVAGVLPGLKKIAAETKVTLLDMNTPLSGHADWFGDRVHPNADGAKTIAGTAFRAITGQEPPGQLMPMPAKK